MTITLVPCSKLALACSTGAMSGALTTKNFISASLATKATSSPDHRGEVGTGMAPIFSMAKMVTTA